MMVGKMLCMVAYVMYWSCGGLKHDGPEEENTAKPNMFLFLPPALCDVTATSMMYIGLNLTTASQFQMLRGGFWILILGERGRGEDQRPYKTSAGPG